MMFVGDGVMELGSAVATTDIGVAAGIGVWPEQATRTMRIGTSAQIGVLSFASCSPSDWALGPDYRSTTKVIDGLGLVKDWASITSNTIERRLR